MQLRKPQVGVVVATLGKPGTPSCKWRVQHTDEIGNKSIVLACNPNEFPLPAWVLNVDYGREVQFLPTSVARADGLDYIGKLDGLADPEPFVPQWQRDGHASPTDALKANAESRSNIAAKQSQSTVTKKQAEDRLRCIFRRKGERLRKHRDDGTFYSETIGKGYLKRYGEKLDDLLVEFQVLQPNEVLEDNSDATGEGHNQ